MIVMSHKTLYPTGGALSKIRLSAPARLAATRHKNDTICLVAAMLKVGF